MAAMTRGAGSVNYQAGKTASCLDVRVDRLREFDKVVLLDRRFWLHVQDGMLGIEVVFDHLSLLYDRCGPRAELADGTDAQGHSDPTQCRAVCRIYLPGSRPWGGAKSSGRFA